MSPWFVIDGMSPVFIEDFRQQGVGPFVGIVFELCIIRRLRGHFLQHLKV